MKVNLVAARVNAKLTQEAVAKTLKISKSTLINWEKGRTTPTIMQFKELTSLYGVNMDDIILPSILL